MNGYLETIAPDILRWWRARAADGFAPVDLAVVVRDRANGNDGPLVCVELRARVLPMLADSTEGQRPGVLARIAGELLQRDPEVVPLVWCEGGCNQWRGREFIVESMLLHISGDTVRAAVADGNIYVSPVRAAGHVEDDDISPVLHTAADGQVNVATTVANDTSKPRTKPTKG